MTNLTNQTTLETLEAAAREAQENLDAMKLYLASETIQSLFLDCADADDVKLTNKEINEETFSEEIETETEMSFNDTILYAAVAISYNSAIAECEAVEANQ